MVAVSVSNCRCNKLKAPSSCLNFQAVVGWLFSSKYSFFLVWEKAGEVIDRIKNNNKFRMVWSINLSFLEHVPDFLSRMYSFCEDNLQTRNTDKKVAYLLRHATSSLLKN
jgi:hypothetical protein